LCEDRAGQENVGSLKVGRRKQDGEDEVESLPNTVSLTRASVAVAVRAWRAAYQNNAVLVVLDAVPALVVIRDGLASRRGADAWDVTVVTLSVECFACGGDRRGRRRVKRVVCGVPESEVDERLGRRRGRRSDRGKSAPDGVARVGLRETGVSSAVTTG
jgi:hypothetical protein